MRVYYVNKNFLRAVRKWNQNPYIFTTALFFTLFVSLFMLFCASYKRYASQPVEHAVFFHPMCGGSEIQNVLLRHGLARRLNFVLPASGVFLGYPGAFDPVLHVSAELWPPAGHRFHIMAHLTRFNPEAVSKILPPHTKRITVLRDPVARFESMYRHWFEQLQGGSLEELLHTLKSVDLPRHVPHHVGRSSGPNQMRYDLGSDNLTDSAALISHVEQNFELVLLAEHLEPSLVLLADLMAWPLQEVAFLTREPPQPRLNLSGEEESQIRALNSADEALYRHFEIQFKQRIQRYGAARMQTDINKLLKINEKLFEECLWRKEANNGTFVELGLIIHSEKLYQIKKAVSAHCEYFLKSEVEFTHLLRKQQQNRFKVIRDFQNLMKIV